MCEQSNARKVLATRKSRRLNVRWFLCRPRSCSFDSCGCRRERRRPVKSRHSSTSRRCSTFSSTAGSLECTTSTESSTTSRLGHDLASASYRGHFMTVVRTGDQCWRSPGTFSRTGLPCGRLSRSALGNWRTPDRGWHQSRRGG